MFNIANREMQNKTRMKYHLTPDRMAIIKKFTNSKCWRGCAEKGNLLHCWWECKLVQPLWRTICAKSLHLCPTLCDPMDCNLPGPSVYEILQARILEWVVIPFSRGSSQPRKQTWVSCRQILYHLGHQGTQQCKGTIIQ